MRLKRIGIPALVVGLVVGLNALPAAGDEHDHVVDITLLHDTHFHGSFGDAEPRAAACVDDPEDAGFSDVSDGNVHQRNINCAASLEILRGVGGGEFDPRGAVTRAQAATLVAGALSESGVSLPDGPDPLPFTDAVNNIHASSIGSLAELGVIRGRTATTFAPEAPVRRDQLASMLVQAAEVGLHMDVDAASSPFEDIGGNTHESNIDAAYELGLMVGRTSTTFLPAGTTTREQAASTVVQLVDRVLPTGPSTVNIARYMGLINDIKADNEDALFIGNGDDIAPSVLGSVFEGRHMIEAFNASPLDINTLGNHEFDFGPDVARDRIADSDFQWVSANVRNVDDTTEPFAADHGVKFYDIVDVDGVDVGITGLGPEGMPTVTNLTRDGDDSGAEHIGMVEAMDEVLPMMEADGADVIVVASHLCGTDARVLADEVDGIDAIVGDHCAEVLEEPEIINDTIVSLAGDEFDWLAELTFSVVDGQAQVDELSFTLHDVTHVHEGDPEIQEIVDRWEAELDDALGETIGFRENEWDVRTTAVRSGETGFANYIVDSMRMQVDADVAITNGGGIRSDQIYAGGEDIILRDVFAILPFGNTVVKTAESGATILDALEHGLAAGTPQGRFPQVSGMTYEWDPDADPGERVVEVTVDGEPLDEDATYTLATNDFMLGGGDGYDMFGDEVIIPPEGAQPMLDAVIDRIRDEENVTVETDGRISRTGD
jgi:2',3'-cyclic-nucleotide 2'-phosphodiesterase (5'-nucleotidase family)